MKSKRKTPKTLSGRNPRAYGHCKPWCSGWFKFSFGSLQQRISAKRRSYQTPFRYSHRSYNQQ